MLTITRQIAHESRSGVSFRVRLALPGRLALDHKVSDFLKTQLAADIDVLAALRLIIVQIRFVDNEHNRVAISSSTLSHANDESPEGRANCQNEYLHDNDGGAKIEPSKTFSAKNHN